MTPRVGWGAMGWMVGEQMRLAAPRHSYWTAVGASVWDFPHSGEGGVEKGERISVMVTHSTQSELISPT